MIPKDGVNLDYIKAALLRRFWYITVPFFVVVVGGIVHAIKSPELYRAETVILVERQTIPTDMIRSTITTSLSDRIRTISEQVKSRTRLEKIIEELDLYPRLRAGKTMTDAVEAFRSHISINLGRRFHSSSFSIAFLGKDRAKVRDVTNRIANLFIEDNLRLREEQAFGTTEFLDKELKKVAAELREKEKMFREFSLKYHGMLPGQADNNYRMLDTLQGQLNSINTAIQSVENRKLAVETQLKNLKSREEVPMDLFEEGGIGDQSIAGNLMPSGEDELAGRLESLQMRYTDKHPDVIRLKAAIANMKEKEAAAGGLPDDDLAPMNGGAGEFSLAELREEGFMMQLSAIKDEIETLRKQKQETMAQIRLYRHRIERAPEIEAKFLDLQRDHGQVNRTYQTLLGKKQQAKLAENLERAQKGEQFRIIDAATLPEKPFQPDLRKILATVLMIALASGFGLAFLREYLNTAFWSSKHLESVIRLPVLISVPNVLTPFERRRRLLKKIGAASVLASMGSILVYTFFLLKEAHPKLFPMVLG